MKQFDKARFRELVGEYIGHADADTVVEVAKQYFDELNTKEESKDADTKRTNLALS